MYTRVQHRNTLNTTALTRVYRLGDSMSGVHYSACLRLTLSLFCSADTQPHMLVLACDVKA